MIYQAVGYKRTLRVVATSEPQTHQEVLRPVRHGDRTTSFNVASAQADWLAQEHPDLIWNVETIGASQQVRSGRLRA